MTKLTLEQQELLFANDCKLINLRYEYHGYTGTEKWAIVTELAEEELWVKYRRLMSLQSFANNNSCCSNVSFVIVVISLNLNF